MCFASNFFEHLESKRSMDAVLHEARRVLKPGGRFVCMQPNIRYAPDRYWDFYDHVLPLSHPSFVHAYLRLPFVWRFFGGQFVLVARSPVAV